MYFFEDIKFDLKYNLNQYVKQQPQDNLIEFILAYTNVPREQIEKINEADLKELASFVYSKINISDKDLLLENISNFVFRMNTDIRFSMIILLSHIGYKLNEVYEWDTKKLFDIFLLECVKKQTMKESFLKLMNVYYANHAEEIKKQMDIWFPDTLYGALDDNTKSNDEQIELIEKLSQL